MRTCYLILKNFSICKRLIKNFVSNPLTINITRILHKTAIAQLLITKKFRPLNIIFLEHNHEKTKI